MSSGAAVNGPGKPRVMSKTLRRDGRGIGPMTLLALLSLVFAGAMFGFFFARQ